MQAEQQSERKRFEAWHIPRYGKGYSEWAEDKGRYAWDLTEELWAAWQARAALSHPSTPQTEVAGTVEQYWMDNRGKILDAIEAAGFRLLSNSQGFWLNAAPPLLKQGSKG